MALPLNLSGLGSADNQDPDTAAIFARMIEHGKMLQCVKGEEILGFEHLQRNGCGSTSNEYLA